MWKALSFSFTYSLSQALHPFSFFKKLQKYFHLWGRVTFEMLATGIKKKDKELLSQLSVALPGVVDAIQLVFMDVVPQIKEVFP